MRGCKVPGDMHERAWGWLRMEEYAVVMLVRMYKGLGSRAIWKYLYTVMIGRLHWYLGGALQGGLERAVEVVDHC